MRLITHFTSDNMDRYKWLATSSAQGEALSCSCDAHEKDFYKDDILHGLADRSACDDGSNDALNVWFTNSAVDLGKGRKKERK